jgi:DNA-binding MarR family transcriptional regulator
MAADSVLDSLDRIVRAAVGLTATSLVTLAPRTELTLVGWRALAVVAGPDGPMRVGEIAQRLGTSAPSASRLVRRLEQHGYVSVERDDVDRRVALVRATESGHAMWVGVLAHRRAEIARLLAARAPLPSGIDDGLRAIAAALDGLA